MQTVTRTLTKYRIRAYEVAVDADGQPEVRTLAECEAVGTSMRKSQARAELAEAAGCKMPSGCLIDVQAVGTETYSMPLETFVCESTLVKTMSLEA